MRKLISVLAAVIIAAATMVAFQSAPANSAAKVKHEIKIIDAGEIKNSGRFFVKGKVPTAAKKTIKLERKVGNQGRKLYKKMKSNNKGKFAFQFDGPTGSCFYVVAPKTAGYKKTSVKIGCIVRV
ncbi:hypothetical protein [Nocardioides sp.]|uniref:hypothetical protein n=1 Tax=Nocardioides sp. TaxID=35761 RepID=UPI001A2F2E39|nr:hypothetical protein [Nocardioides sp.]MBJ7359954.1 hypothetical protein [Nocardioides sp.]